jgi:hypothetical protein
MLIWGSPIGILRGRAVGSGSIASLPRNSLLAGNLQGILPILASSVGYGPIFASGNHKLLAQFPIQQSREFSDVEQGNLRAL